MNCLKYVAGMGVAVVTGFDWPAIEVIARGAGIKLRPLILEKLRALEDITIKNFNETIDAKGGGAHG